MTSTTTTPTPTTTPAVVLEAQIDEGHVEIVDPESGETIADFPTSGAWLTRGEGGQPLLTLTFRALLFANGYKPAEPEQVDPVEDAGWVTDVTPV
jgi:hypothetical protein